jgi:hypothetical protein
VWVTNGKRKGSHESSKDVEARLSLEHSCGSLWSPLVTFLDVIVSRGVHGSVRFKLKKLTEPNYSIFV